MATAAKSGLRVLKVGETLFDDGEVAESLYIIQKGQVRLFKPKGKGFIEIAVLHAGEVIGEMAYFDGDGAGRNRSCSASAITQVEVIEISFAAFGKTIESLNPWFKTIISTLAARLRKSNLRIKELEDNQASLSYGNKPSGYEFLKSIEVMRILGTIFLVFKAHGEQRANSLSLARKTLTLYTADMYQIQEAKLESVLRLLVDQNILEIEADNDGFPNILLMKGLESIRQLFIFYNSERHLPANKKIQVSDKCELLMSTIIDFAPVNPPMDIPNLRITEEIKPKFTKYFLLDPVLNDVKKKNSLVNPEHLEDGRNIGIFGEVLTQDNQLFVELDFPKLIKMFPIIRFMNAVRKINDEKAL